VTAKGEVITIEPVVIATVVTAVVLESKAVIADEPVFDVPHPPEENTAEVSDGLDETATGSKIVKDSGVVVTASGNITST
jgi:hypothetical protein